jgi:hypothetical protein
MVSAVLSRTDRKDWHEEGFADGEGIGGGTPHEPEVDPEGLSDRGKAPRPFRKVLSSEF